MLDNLIEQLHHSDVPEKISAIGKIAERHHDVVAVQYFFETIPIGHVPYQTTLAWLKESYPDSDDDNYFANHCDDIGEAIELYKSFNDYFGLESSVEEENRLREKVGGDQSCYLYIIERPIYKG